LGSGEGCYIRFYIDKEKEAEAVKILGKDIPDEYKNEIFKGIREAKMGKEIIGYEASGGGYGAIEDIKGGENDTCLYVNDVDWEKLKTVSRFKNYYQYKDVIIRECQAENLNVRLTLAHFQAESAGPGGALSSNAWRKYNNPSGMLGNLKSVHGVPCVTTSADNIGGNKTSHGKFLKFESPEIGFKAHCRWVNRSSFYGVRTKNLRTVNQYAVAMQYGVPAGGASLSFCGGPNYRCPNYGKNIITHYKDIPHLTKE
jgi:hypothetical protein